MARIEINETICGDILGDEATVAAGRLIGELYRTLLVEEYQRALPGCECDLRVDMSVGGLHEDPCVNVDGDKVDASTMRLVEDASATAYDRLIQAYCDSTVPGVIWLEGTGEWVAEDGDKLTGDSAMAYAHEHKGTLFTGSEETEREVSYDEAADLVDEGEDNIWAITEKGAEG